MVVRSAILHMNMIDVRAESDLSTKILDRYRKNGGGSEYEN